MSRSSELFFVLLHFRFALLQLLLLLCGEVPLNHDFGDLISGPLVSVSVSVLLYLFTDFLDFRDRTLLHDLLVQIEVLNELLNSLKFVASSLLKLLIVDVLSEGLHLINIFPRFFDFGRRKFLVIFELHLEVGELVIHLLLDVLLRLPLRHQGALLLLNRLNFSRELHHAADLELLLLGHVLVDLLA